MSVSLTIIFIIIISLVSYYAFGRPDVRQKLIMHPYTVAREGAYMRFLTSGFIHANWMHLIFNMVSFYFFGENVESVLGPIFFALLFLLGIIVSEIPTYLKHKDNPGYYSLGASGGVSAVIFCSITYFPLQELIIFPIPFPIKGYVLGPLYLIYSYYQGKRESDNINHDAHFYGALFGIIFAFIIHPERASSFVETVLGSFGQ